MKSKPLKIMVLGWEDAPYKESLTKDLEKYFPNGNMEMIKTEYEFYQRLQTIFQNIPSVILMHIRFPWTKVQPNMPEPPAEVEDQGYHLRAGFRCRELLHKIAPTIPVVLHSAFDQSELEEELAKLPKNVKYVQDWDGNQLKNAVEFLTR